MKLGLFIFTSLILVSGCTKVGEPPVRTKKLGSSGNASAQIESTTPSETPSTASADRKAESFVHFEAPCASCHEEQRPQEITHIQSMDCVSCHQYNDWSQTVAFSFSHDPKPDSCEQCHGRPESGLRSYPNQGPPADFVMNSNYPGSGHYIGKDCQQCHQTPQEGSEQFVFTHENPNPQACLPCHFNEGLGEHGNDQNVLFQDFGNCQQCHQNFDASQNRNFNPLGGDD